MCKNVLEQIDEKFPEGAVGCQATCDSTCRATYLLQGDDEEGATSCALSDYGQEAGVDCTEVVVMYILGDGDPVKAVLPVGRFPIHVPKLGTAVLRSPGHL